MSTHKNEKNVIVNSLFVIKFRSQPLWCGKSFVLVLESTYVFSFMASYHFNSDDMSVDSEIPIMSSLILNLPVQSLKSACYGRICICEFIGIIMQVCFLKQNYVQLLHKNIIQGLINQRNVYSSQIGEPYPCSQVTFVQISWRSDWL